MGTVPYKVHWLKSTFARKLSAAFLAQMPWSKQTQVNSLIAKIDRSLKTDSFIFRSQGVLNAKD